ncbi:hypothetical protein [Actinoplanes sp. L3-i22]|uniref:hypothetical protein n=1 Tax=Actinoplanes sp. L3-i22 TaxID=2836373 RepID=UPI002102C1EA|nr:hypothetical protein [Actinoplanes sp. L3-i22]
MTAWPVVPPTARLDRSRATITLLRAEIGQWFDTRAADERFALFKQHFVILRQVFGTIVDRVDEQFDALAGSGGTAGEIHAACRDLDRRRDLVARTFRWYRAKYDQRDRQDLPGKVIRAADQLVRSCWEEPFTVAGVDRPSGPLAYLDDRFDAVSTPRVSVPSDLRAPDDELIGEFVRQLPIPVVALPATSVHEPWWLVLCAHEVGHHVQFDLDPGLVGRTREAISGAVLDRDEDVRTLWPSWSLEVFADAFAVLSVGTAAAYAVTDLEYGPPATLAYWPGDGDRYPPPAVRLALHGELARAAGLNDPGPGAQDVTGWLDRLPAGGVVPAVADLTRRLLAATAAVARALLTVEVGGRDLPRLCGLSAGQFTTADQWRNLLVQQRPVFAGLKTRPAARSAIAAGVAAFAGAIDDPVRRDLAGRNLVDLLVRCGPPGTLAASREPDLVAIGGRLADLLVGGVPR